MIKNFGIILILFSFCTVNGMDILTGAVGGYNGVVDQLVDFCSSLTLADTIDLGPVKRILNLPDDASVAIVDERMSRVFARKDLWDWLIAFTELRNEFDDVAGWAEAMNLFGDLYVNPNSASPKSDAVNIINRALIQPQKNKFKEKFTNKINKLEMFKEKLYAFGERREGENLYKVVMKYADTIMVDIMGKIYESLSGRSVAWGAQRQRNFKDSMSKMKDAFEERNIPEKLLPLLADERTGGLHV